VFARVVGVGVDDCYQLSVFTNLDWRREEYLVVCHGEMADSQEDRAESPKNSNNYYLELNQVPITFEPIDQVDSAFFDQSNFQMFCVQHGFTDVKVKGLTQEDNFKITIPSRGPVSTIKFSGGTPRVLSIQRRKISVEFVNIFADNSQERSLPAKPGPDIIGFYWIFKNDFVVLISTGGIEVYSCNPYKMSFKLVKSYSLSISWAIFSPNDLILLVSLKGSNVLQPFVFREGNQSAIFKMQKFEVESPILSSSPSMSIRDAKNATVMERDMVIMNLYGVHYVGLIRNTLQPGQGAEVLLYQLREDNNPVRLVHILMMDISGRFTLSVVDDLVIVHHQAWKTSLLFDIMYNHDSSSSSNHSSSSSSNGGATHTGAPRRHQAVLAPLPIAPTKLQIRHKGGKARALSPLGSISSVSSSPGDSPSMYKKRTIVPELYSTKWVFFQPDLIIDAQFGVIWRLMLNLEATSNMLPDKSMLIQFLLMRKTGKGVVLNLCRECLKPGHQVSLGILGGMLDQINMAYKRSTMPSDLVYKPYKVVISQRDMYARVFVPFSEGKETSYRYLVAALVEYIRSLHKVQLTVEHFLYELVMNVLIENRCFYQLHQFLQYHVISDSKPLACLLLSRELVYPPATQLAMDMFKRLSTADSEIIDILLSRGQLLPALRYVRATDKVDSVSARQFLEAAANEDDRSVFYTVYKFFEERNIRLRRNPVFPPDEHCQQYEQMFREYFLNH